MTSRALYLLDANIFFEAQNLYYANDIAPGFWDALLHHAAQNHIMSIDRVSDELVNRSDFVATWARNEFAPYFAPTTQDKAIVNAYGSLQQWAQQQSQYRPAAVDDFARKADAWLIAFAHIHNATLVTHEKSSPDSKKRIMIPDACVPLNVRTVSPYHMLRALNVQLHWSPT